MSYWEVKLTAGIHGWRAHYAGNPNQFATGNTPDEALQGLRMLNPGPLNEEERVGSLQLTSSIQPRNNHQQRLMNSLVAVVIVLLALIGYSKVQTDLTQNQPAPAHKALYLHRADK